MELDCWTESGALNTNEGLSQSSIQHKRLINLNVVIPNLIMHYLLICI